LYPRVFFRRWGDQIEVSWKSTGLVGAPDEFRFAAPIGVSRHSVGEVAAALYSIVKEATDVLIERHPTSERVLALKETLEAVQQDRTQTRVEWLTGLSSERFGTIWSEARSALENVEDRIKETLLQPEVDRLVITASPHLAVLFGSVDPDISVEDVLTLTRIMVEVYQDGDAREWPRLPELEDLIEEVQASGLRDYEQGNRLADGYLHDLEINDEERIDIEELLTSFEIRLDRLALSDEGIRGLSIAGPGHRPAIFTNPAYHDGDTQQVRRFTLAHEFCHLLFDQQRAARLAVISGSWAPRDVERRANAFAAALLMPRALLDNAAASSVAIPGTVEWIYEIARIADTNGMATLERLANLGLLDEHQREVLRDSLRARYQENLQSSGE
jgi:Zn-dependent peptidase ImmA (M78 family)